MMLFERVLFARPDYVRAQEYKAHCEKELNVWAAIEDAGLTRDDIDGAVEGRTGGGSGDAATWADPT